MSGFVHLHNHTDYSLLDGAGSIPKYIAKAKELGMNALAITDHGNMFGAHKFYKACKAADIKPIIGCEFYVAPESHTLREGVEGKPRAYHLILLAMNEKGYHNLMELNSISYVEGFYYKPRIDHELIEQHNEGVLCLSACLGGEIASLLKDNRYEDAKKAALWHASVFDGGRYYLEIQDHGLPEQKTVNQALARLSTETGIPLVATNDIHYINKSDANAHDILLCIGMGKKKNEADRMRFHSAEYYMKSAEEMEKQFLWCPQAVENTVKIADLCNLEIHFPGPRLPRFRVPKGFTDDSYLRHLSHEGLARRYAEVTPDLEKRLDYELDVIIQMGFQGYFLIVRDYIYWAKQRDIPVGPGRGSGAGSLVAYCTEITDVDPIKYNLLFERFLNPERKTMPDFDIDFCFEHRQEVIEYVTEHYGEDHVAQIATFGTLKAKAVVKDVARVLDIPFEESNRIAKMIPDDPKMTLKKALEQSPELKQVADAGGIYGELFDAAFRLEGLNRHTSTHAAGVVIGEKKLLTYVPLYRDAKTGAISTQFTMDQLEENGLVKMDLLGLKTLTLIKHTVDLVHKTNPGFSIEDINEEDEKTFDMLRRGDSACVFQFESTGMQKILRDALPNSIEDLVALNALYRPGPMDYIPQFVESKNGRMPITYAHPDLEETLKTTYGVIVYQEQVMKVAQIIGGYTLGAADILRRIMSKKKAEELAAQEVKFVEGALAKGYQEKLARYIFKMLEPFAGYGFNKSHAVAYSVIAYQTAFLKANYPAEFMAANLTNEINNPDKFSEYLREAKHMGIEVLPPSINYSERQFNAVEGKIVYGLAGIKNVGEGVADLIIRERNEHGPYESFIDFLVRVDSRAMNSKLLESLIKAGTFDSMEENRPTLIENMEAAVIYAQKQKESKESGQSSLFEGDDIDSFTMTRHPDWEMREKLEIEKALLGFYISGHPLDLYRDAWKRSVLVDFSRPERFPRNRQISLVAMITDIRTLMTKKQTMMGFLELVDFSGTLEATCFPNAWAAVSGKIEKDGIYGFQGKFEYNPKRESIGFIVDAVCDPYSLDPVALKEAHIQIEKHMCSDDMIETLKDVIVENLGRGRCRTIFHIEDSAAALTAAAHNAEEAGFEASEAPEDSEETLSLPAPQTVIAAGYEFSVDYSEKLIEDLKKIPGVTGVWFD
ncbi:DNA polymerase III subunit alpha [Parasphaerochaeta coccoides]|uniref:DNA polymerase III subunit alpha n=1 Tax=Parasphaerochaeta coccoides (strain ATCC BAA-1237 / DSM 17374 / SPN1) TaxID=760011 RepID=F4GLV2_PARC1|nr:DNA polymerase III subunit alpha [Parasphaerochaeta coccoides]AEC02993.1 DNA polymerase III, alpha subunit [Parasphaerochaeta coccoides DSM 17374]